MNARSINSAAGVVQAAMEQGRQTATGIAVALDAAGLLMSPETAAELERLREERHSTNESLSKADVALHAARERIVELEALTPASVQTCRKCGAGYTYGEPCSTCAFKARMAAELSADGITRRIAPTQALRERLEDPHDSPLHRKDLIPRDLPEAHVPFAAETQVEPSGCRYCGIPARVHAQQWKAPVGWHQWVLPTDAQIKRRMLARRAARGGA